MIRVIGRRSFLLSLPVLANAPRVLAQAGGSSIPLRALNHVGLTVSDPQRSLEFYQGLFGMPIQARQGATTLLRIGDGPQFLAVSGTGAGEAPSISRMGVAVDDFDANRIVEALATHGVTRAEPGAGGGLAGGPMKVRTRMRGSEAGGAPRGTLELYLGDPDGLVVQIQDLTYCGGGGTLGNVCGATPEPAPTEGVLAVRDLSHFTVSASNGRRSNQFYQEVFGLPVQVLQGTTPALGIGGGPQFLMFGGGGATRRPARIGHVCLTVEGFDKDRILQTLADFGIQPRGDDPGPVGPLTSYVSMRMENRGGAPEGTPELYFTDPDGLLIQLQDTTYCGGGGLLGEICG